MIYLNIGQDVQPMHTDSFLLSELYLWQMFFFMLVFIAFMHMLLYVSPEYVCI